MESLAFANPGLAKLVVIGKAGRALKVTKDAGTVADGARPASAPPSTRRAARRS
jgi:hypothetical protein